MGWVTDPQGWIAFATLLALEIVLGIDNIVFISILAGRLPENERQRARALGLLLAMLMRVALLLSLSWMMRLTAPLLVVVGRQISGRDLILLGGGLFLVAKATHEIHARLEGAVEQHRAQVRPAFAGVIAQIMLLDIVFSLDSVITAIGMVDVIGIMIAAVVAAVGVMVAFSGVVSRFIQHHPTVKMLALSFLLLIGVTLLAEGWGQHISRGYIYFAMAFSLFVELLNLRVRTLAAAPVKLRETGP